MSLRSNRYSWGEMHIRSLFHFHSDLACPWEHLVYFFFHWWVLDHRFPLSICFCFWTSPSRSLRNHPYSIYLLSLTSTSTPRASTMLCVSAQLSCRVPSPIKA